MTVLKRLENQLAATGMIDFADLGGVEAALVDVVAASPYFDAVVAPLAGRWPELASAEARSWLLGGLQTNPHPTRLANALDEILDIPAVLDDVGSEMARVLLERARVRGNAADALLAATSLEGALRLAIGGYVPRYSVLAVLIEVAGPEDFVFAARAARLLGAAYDSWPEADLRAALIRVAAIPGAEGDAAVELGMTYLRDALAGDSVDAVVLSLRTALDWFERGERVEEDREDARALRLVCGILIDLAMGTEPGAIEAQTDELCETAALAALYERDASRSWLHPRATAALELSRLLAALIAARVRVSEPSWYRPAESLEATLDAYLALRGVRVVVRSEQHLTPGIAVIIEPAIEAGFIRNEGLRHHLKTWLEMAVSGGDDARRQAAQTILARVQAERPGQPPFRGGLS